PRPWVATVAITLGALVIILDTSIITVALPHMQGGLSASQDQISWVVTVYLVVLAVMTPPTGWFSKQFGRKRLYLVSLTVFASASMACGLADSLEQVIVARMVQAAFGAFLVPLTQATLLDIHPREQHAKALSIWSFGMTFGPFLGPSLGGMVTDAFGWRESFFISVPFCIVAFVLIAILIPEKRDETRLRFNATGFALLSIGVGALQITLDRGERSGWFSSDLIMLTAVAAGFGIIAFALHSATARQPFFQPMLLRDRNFIAATFLFFVLGLVQFTTLTLMPAFLHDVLDYTPLLIGWVLAPRALGAMVGNGIYTFIPRSIADPRITAGVGLVCILLSYVGLMHITADIDIWYVGLLVFLQGFGMPWVFITLNTVGFSTLATELRAEAASVFNLLRGIGGSMGVALLVTLLTRNIQINRAEITENVNRYNDMLQVPPGPSAWNPDLEQGLAALDRLVNQQATVIAYVNNFWFMAGLVIASLPLLLILGGASRRR
ncbi:MAG: DHA2 family efflux MFS transporter permease subunit, partial [Alphaproteobacteria bacterium]